MLFRSDTVNGSFPTSPRYCVKSCCSPTPIKLALTFELKLTLGTYLNLIVVLNGNPSPTCTKGAGIAVAGKSFAIPPGSSNEPVL